MVSCVLAHLDFFDATSETAGLASGILGPFPLLGLIARLLSDYVDRTTTAMGLGIVASGGDVSVRGGGARGEVRVASLGGGEGTDYVMLSAIGFVTGGMFSGGCSSFIVLY